MYTPLVQHINTSTQPSFCMYLHAGRNVPNQDKQLRECVLQAKRLVELLQQSKHTLTHLHLTVRLVWGCIHPRERSFIDHDFDEPSTRQPYSTGSSILHIEKSYIHANHTVNCPPRLVDLPLAVFSRLAVAVPNLRNLSLLGHNVSAALSAFGSMCPKIHRLTVEASSVPRQVMQDLHLHLPNLEHLRVTRRGDKGHCLNAFMEGALAAASLCGNLITLEIDFGKNVEILCAFELWNALPRSLRKFRSTAALKMLRGAPSMFSTLTHVDMVKSVYSDLLILMQFAPCMEELSLLHREIIELDCSKFRNSEGSVSPEQSAMQQRLINVRITCPCFKLRGSYAEVDEVMSWLSPVASTDVWIQLTASAATEIEFLEHAAVVFPEMKTLNLRVVPEPLHPQAISMSEDRMAWLMQCKTLKQIHLRHHIAWTNAGLARLCMSLPLLNTVKCFYSPGLDRQELQWYLNAKKPRCNVALYRL